MAECRREPKGRRDPARRRWNNGGGGDRSLERRTACTEPSQRFILPWRSPQINKRQLQYTYTYAAACVGALTNKKKEERDEEGEDLWRILLACFRQASEEREREREREVLRVTR